MGAGCRIGVGAHRETGVSGEDVQVDPGARLHGCLVGRGVRIGAHAVVPPGAVLGDGSVLSDYSRLEEEVVP
jgi:carbonic anhydrase/acetyltransferase-like protein (isoleucine patch superfamily)